MIYKYKSKDGRSAAIDLSRLASIQPMAKGHYDAMFLTEDDNKYESRIISIADDDAEKLIKAWEDLKAPKLS